MASAARARAKDAQPPLGGDCPEARGSDRWVGTCVLVSPQCEEEGQTFLSLDDGNTKFSDLIQLVDFYQLNKGVLPCKLKHHCIRVAL